MPEIVDAMPGSDSMPRSRYAKFTDGQVYLFRQGVDYTVETRVAVGRTLCAIHYVLLSAGRSATERVTTRSFANHFYLQVVPR